MAVYKVPQDVEADDKLLGPFSFKQFIFLVVCVMMLGLAYMLSQILLPLAILPLPIAIFFGVLALPLRKDQPMEIYLAAVISFMTKPKKRIWEADGIESFIEITAPKIDESLFGKGYDQEEVQKRLSYLSNLIDSRGWSIRNVQSSNSSMQQDLYNEAQTANDFLDENNTTSRQIGTLINQADERRQQDIRERMHQPAAYQTENNIPAVVAPANPQPVVTPEPVYQTPADNYAPQQTVVSFNPYPTMQQGVISPISDQNTPNVATATAEPEREEVIAPNFNSPELGSSSMSVSPAIIDLASNHDNLSVETLQREAKRLQEMEDEVVISLH